MTNKIKREDILNYLEREKIDYNTIDFNVLGGERPENIKSDFICKTLIVKTKENKHISISIPFNKQLDYKKAKEVLNTKKVRLADNVEEISGFPHGANGPIGIYLNNKDIEIYLDNSFKKYEKIISNAGEVGRTVYTTLKDLENVTNAKYEDFTKE